MEIEDILLSYQLKDRHLASSSYFLFEPESHRILLFNRCRFEKQARMKKFAQSAKDKDDTNPIIIPVPISDEPKGKQEPVVIPVRFTSNTSKSHLFLH